MDTFSERNDIMLIPKSIRCPQCDSNYNPFDLLERMILPESNVKCNACGCIITKEYVGKFFGVIKNVGR